MFSSPGPIFLTWGPLTIRWYGVMIALGFLGATYFATRLARQLGIDKDKIINGTLLSFVAGIVGARAYFVALSWPYFSVHPDEIIATWNGGLSIHGGIAGGLLAGLIYCRRAKLPILTCCDIGGIVTSLGQAIGRWGNFFNSEAFGKPVSEAFPLKLYIPYENRPIGYQGSEYFHATFLYESLWDLTIFVVLYFLAFKYLKRYPGITFLLYLAVYSCGRLFIEPLRTDSIMLCGFAVPMLASLVCLVISLIGCIVLGVKYHIRPQARS
ncbi:MAG: prolipoprotein diacylglyceryl transferase [Candidatus Melainabacteria bacterium]|nr:prolipoprotein diacylglyceryl transferase [Candidatus Melainabacteria bacterium]